MTREITSTHIGLYGPVGLVSRVDEGCGGVRSNCHGHGVRFLVEGLHLGHPRRVVNILILQLDVLVPRVQQAGQVRLQPAVRCQNRQNISLVENIFGRKYLLLL